MTDTANLQRRLKSWSTYIMFILLLQDILEEMILNLFTLYTLRKTQCHLFLTLVFGIKSVKTCCSLLVIHMNYCSLAFCDINTSSKYNTCQIEETIFYIIFIFYIWIFLAEWNKIIFLLLQILQIYITQDKKKNKNNWKQDKQNLIHQILKFLHAKNSK